MRLFVFALAQVFAGTGALAATAEERIGELERKLEESVKVINQLSQEVQQLKGESAKARPARVSGPAASISEPAAPSFSSCRRERPCLRWSVRASCSSRVSKYSTSSVDAIRCLLVPERSIALTILRWSRKST